MLKVDTSKFISLNSLTICSEKWHPCLLNVAPMTKILSFFFSFISSFFLLFDINNFFLSVSFLKTSKGSRLSRCSG